jgi:hypothetical protein
LDSREHGLEVSSALECGVRRVGEEERYAEAHDDGGERDYGGPGEGETVQGEEEFVRHVAEMHREEVVEGGFAGLAGNRSVEWAV